MEGQDELTLETKNSSGIKGDMRHLTREEVRAIKKLCEIHMINEGTHKFLLGGSNWADLDNLRTRCKTWLVDHQTERDSK